MLIRPTCNTVSRVRTILTLRVDLILIELRMPPYPDHHSDDHSTMNQLINKRVSGVYA